MRKLVIVWLVLFGCIAQAQPVNPRGGVVAVTATANGGVTIGGTAARPSVGLTTGCGAQAVLVWAGSAWSCTGAVTVSGLLTVTGSDTIVTNADTDTWIRVANTASGGRSWEWDSAATASPFGAGLSLIDVTAGIARVTFDLSGNVHFFEDISTDGSLTALNVSILRHLKANGTSVSLTNASCNSTTCNDVAGTVTASSTSFTVTFAATYTGADDATCIVQEMNGTVVPTFTTSATAITATTAVNGAKYHYLCVGH